MSPNVNPKIKLDCLIRVKPNTFMLLGFIVIAVAGLAGNSASRLVLWHGPVPQISGWVLFLAGWAFHLYCHRYYQKAHEVSNHIQDIVTTGPFALIRHPMYVSLILMYWGMAIALGMIWTWIPAALFSVLVITTALKEEEFLTHKLDSEYMDYMTKVPWRFIPKVF